MSGFGKWCGFLLAAVLALLSQPALASKRVALVLANANYQNAGQLANPVNDGALMADTFRNAGFDVVDARFNLTALDTRRTLREFADRAQDADIAIVYYAGHGLEVDGQNYLIPVDARLERDTDVFDEAFSLDRVMVAVEPAKQLRLVILDACRDNPFAKSMKRTVATRAVGLGLAKIEPSSPNTLVAYSARAGSTAQDGAGRNSPFTIALARHLPTPGLDVRKAFGFVRDDVLKATANRQEPFVYGSLGGDDLPLVPGMPKVVPQVQSIPNPQAEIRHDYELALQVGNRAAFEAFLTQHPDGFYASLAKLQLDKITAEAAHAAAIAKAQVAEQERARLATEGARKEAQAKADADAKAAEAAQAAAEKAKQAAQDQAAAAERRRADKAALEDAPAPPANGETGSPRATADKSTQVASLSEGVPQADLARSEQAELRRVGCLTTDADGDWNAASQRSLSQFNRYAGTKFDTKAASGDALDAIRQKTSRVCPLKCDHGYQADGDRCAKIVCAEGSFLNDDSECEKRRARTKDTAKRDDEDRRARRARAERQDRDDRQDRQDRQDRYDRAPVERPNFGPGYSAGLPAPPQPPAAPRRSQAQGSGQIFCDGFHCRPVNPGCHIEDNAQLATRASSGLAEVCR
ncbi:MAG: caspase family protein [Bradyrhizobium sp.]|uniref:caspase family protein n=1 Tax=Bradyrhizobium sp. TaxID=376 RepID=UPI001D991265|nr:caspase family protein [Bradyrhizobium sp.]MBV9561205.1 caspase family protein [Bradyrhizobium sp.]